MGAAANVCLVRAPSTRSSFSFFYQDDETTSLVSMGMALLIGLTIGTISSANFENADGGGRMWSFVSSSSVVSGSSFEEGMHSVGVPLYAAVVVLYLTAVAFRQDWWPTYRRLVVRWHRRRSGCSSSSSSSSTPSNQALEAAAVAPIQGPSGSDVPPHDVNGLVIDDNTNDTHSHSHQPVNLTGVYQLVSNDNFEAFLAAQGVPWALRSAANRVRPIHRITHTGPSLTIKIEGIIESQTTYLIGGPPVETSVRGRVFVDTVAYLTDDDNKDHGDTGNPNGDGFPQGRSRRGVVVTKKALTEPYDVTVRRELSEDGQIITLTSRAVFRDGRSPVQSTQVFHRMMVGMESTTPHPERSQ